MKFYTKAPLHNIFIMIANEDYDFKFFMFVGF